MREEEKQLTREEIIERETRSTEQRDFVLYIRPVWESSFGSSVNQEFLIGTNLKVRELSVWRVHYNINRN